MPQDILNGFSIGGIMSTILVLYKMSRQKWFREIVIHGISKIWKLFRGRQILAHYLFTRANDHKKRAAKINFKTEKQTKAFSLLINTKIDTVIELIKKWEAENRGAIKNMAMSDLEDSLRELIKLIKKTYEDRIKQKYLKEFDFDEGSIYYDEMYIKKFEPKHNENIKPLNDLLDDVMSYEKSKNDFINNFLSRIEMAISTAIEDAKITFNIKDDEKN